jgi:hypothetical protein
MYVLSTRNDMAEVNSSLKSRYPIISAISSHYESTFQDAAWALDRTPSPSRSIEFMAVAPKSSPSLPPDATATGRALPLGGAAAPSFTRPPLSSLRAVVSTFALSCVCVCVREREREREKEREQERENF